MLFNSYIFIFFFLPVTLTIYLVLTNKNLNRAAVIWLILASLFFYGWWKTTYVLLILFSILFNFTIGSIFSWNILKNKIANNFLLIIGLAGNLGLLAYYKYADFLIGNINFLLSSHHILPHIVLPIAISFFTFEQVAYLVDAYRAQTPHYGFIDYCFFVTFFPRLIAGPIVRHYEVLPQLKQRKTFGSHYENISIGFTLFFMGLFKKVVFAGAMASYSDPVFSGHISLSFITAWLGVLAYTLQIYFDFSGYSDMAIGLARMFGIILPMNFNSPYKSPSIIDFWRHWHITLSRFLRDYLYFSLGGNRCGKIRRYANLMITMLLGGLWHGANWTFVMWGGLHGLYLIINHAWRAASQRFIPARLVNLFNYKNILPRTLTFVVVVMAWVFFRSETFHQAFTIVKKMFDVASITHFVSYKELIYILLLLSFVWIFPNSQEILKNAKPVLEYESLSDLAKKMYLLWAPSLFWALIAAFIAVIPIIHLGNNSPFIYFDF